jgi:uridine kinase
MNIVEAYIKFKGQLIIFISGLPACGKLILAKTIQTDFSLKLLNQFDYYKEDYKVFPLDNTSFLMSNSNTRIAPDLKTCIFCIKTE